MAIEDDRGLRGLLRGVLEAPAAGLDDLPELLAALEHDDPHARIGAAWGICAVAAARPDSAADLRRQLEHRDGTAAELAAEWIERECDVDLGLSGDDAASQSPDGSASEHVASRYADAAAGTGAEDPPTAHVGDDTRSDTGDGAGTDAGDDAAAEPADDSTDRDRPPGTDKVVRNERFTVELDSTTIDGLDVVDRVAMDRYSWTYVGMATIDARQRAVLVRTYRPPQGARLSTFARTFEQTLEEWAGVDDHEGVLTVHDYGRDPHPWVVLGYAHDTLRSTGRLPVELALEVGQQAARALAHAHDRGVTHRSLDPRSLAVDAREGSPTARLLNFGIVDAFRAVEGPLPMDSRFAAPELFDDEYGGVDALTDVYQLGATLYTALTGRPPYRDSLVERGGPEGLEFVAPSSVISRVPADVDHVVETAMEPHKIARYESADELARDLGRVRAALDAED